MVFLLFVAFLLLPTGLFLPWTVEPMVDPPIGRAEAPFILVTTDGKEQLAQTSISTANPVTRVEVGDELMIGRLDGGTADLKLELVLLACPDRPGLASSVVQPAEPWTVPRLEADAYALKVSSGEQRGSFGLVVGEGPVREDRC